MGDWRQQRCCLPLLIMAAQCPLAHNGPLVLFSRLLPLQRSKTHRAVHGGHQQLAGSGQVGNVGGPGRAGRHGLHRGQVFGVPQPAEGC